MNLFLVIAIMAILSCVFVGLYLAIRPMLARWAAGEDQELADQDTGEL
jgi:hypothetical protein